MRTPNPRTPNPRRNDPTPPTIAAARVYARSFAQRAVDTLVELMDGAKSEHVRLSATRELMKIGCGKAIKPDADDLSEEEAEAERRARHVRNLAEAHLADLFEVTRRLEETRDWEHEPDPYGPRLSDEALAERLAARALRRTRTAAVSPAVMAEAAST